MELDLSDVKLGSGTIHIGCLRDISERQTYMQALQHQALHDNLTGLPNRVLFGDRVELAIQAALRVGDSLALLLLDLDEFKQVNDTLGHQHGDALLKLVTERIVGCLREWDTVARLGGDEFGILLGEASTWQERRRSSGSSSRRSSRHSSSTARPSTFERASASRSRRCTATTSAICSGAPTWRCTTPSSRAPGMRCSPQSRRRRRREGWRCSATFAAASSATSSWCTINRRSTSRRRRPSESRPWFAGTTRRGACSCRPSSCRRWSAAI